MHVGKGYRLTEFVVWTRREIYILLALGALPVVLYHLLGLKWFAIPWTVAGLVGTATAFIVGFKNTQTYGRTVEAQQIWGAILSASRSWAIMCRDFLKNDETARELIYRHCAWATALRYELRKPREWESLHGSPNAEYQKRYTVPEKVAPLKTELERFLSPEELTHVLAGRNKPLRALGLQSRALRRLQDSGEIPVNFFVELEKAIKEFVDLQSKSVRIKNFPYPRQYATVSTIFVRAFCILLPFGLLREFDALNAVAEGWLKGQMIWLVIPFSVVISWLYLSLMQVGESTENPFEGNPNDVPISQICRMIEVESRDLLGDKDLPPLLQPQNNIIM